jgi:predicted nucleic acid-binding protein
MNYLLDTSAILAHFQGEKEADQVIRILSDPQAGLFLSVVSLVELARKFHAIGMPDNEAEATLSGYQSMFTVTDVDLKVAFNARSVVQATPERLPLIDSLIAGSALSVGAHLVHRDKHLRAIPGSVLNQIAL